MKASSGISKTKCSIAATEGITLEKFLRFLDSYIRWYNEKSIKQSLGAMIPVMYRQHLGITILAQRHISGPVPDGAERHPFRLSLKVYCEKNQRERLTGHKVCSSKGSKSPECGTDTMHPGR